MEPDSLDMDDAWSYSFPPSSDSLPLEKSTENHTSSSKGEDQKSDNVIDEVEPIDSAEVDKENNSSPFALRVDTSFGGTEEKDSSDGSSEQRKVSIHGNYEEKSNDRESNSNSSNESSSSYSNGKKKVVPINIKSNNSNSPSFPYNPSQPGSYSTMSLNTSLCTKSTPANPQTTKEDVSSTFAEPGDRPSVENLLANDAASMSSQQFSSPSAGGNNSGFFTAVRSAAQTAASFSSLKSNSPPPVPEKPSSAMSYIQSQDSSNGHRASASVSTIESTNVEPSPTAPSPKMLSYRKSRGSKRDSLSSPLIDKEKEKDRFTSGGTTTSVSAVENFDKRLYVDEKYMDTHYRYATIKRNTEFHQIFKSIDLTDRLLDDFSCALSREILLQGRLYVSENNVCFNSNLLGWVTTFVIPQSDIVRFEKKVTAGFFPNAITIESRNGKHNFASLVSRDSTYDFMTTIWSKATRDLPIDVLDNPFEVKKTIANDFKSDNKDLDSFSSHSSKIKSENELEQEEQESKLQSYILSIDSDTDSDINDSFDSNGSKLSPQKVVSVLESSGYKNHGPEIHEPTDIEYDPEENEVILATEQLNAPPGLIFDLLYGENIEFHKTFLEAHDASEISEYKSFEDKEGKKERKYTYQKALGYSIGPKSTKCEVSEYIEKLDYDSNIQVLSSTVTPDVPSGNAFSVKTRYIFAWSENNGTQFQLSYYIKWTGRSWIKGVIEKQTLAGQQAAAKDLVEAFKKKLSEITSQVTIPGTVTNKIATPKLRRKESPKAFKEVKLEPVAGTNNTVESVLRAHAVSILILVVFLLILIAFMQLKIILLLMENNKLLKL